MPATFSRVKTWGAEFLTYSDLNAEFDNILTNLTPAGVDDCSANDTAAQATSNPYPGSSLSKATSLQEEIRQLRYQIQQITGKTYWYQPPDASIATVYSTLIPSGVVLPYAGSTAPTGYLLCYGQAVSRTTYANLFAAIGTTYGSGDGSTTFNLPDLRGRFPLGKDNMGGSAAGRVTAANASTLGGASGEENKDISHTHTYTDVVAHQHSIVNRVSSSQPNQDGFVVGVNAPSGGDTLATGTTGSASGTTQSGGSTTQDIMPPYLTLNYIIKH